MPNYKTVQNKCLRDGCGYTWIDGPGQHAACYREGCPKCGSLYWQMNSSDDYEIIVDGNYSGVAA